MQGIERKPEPCSCPGIEHQWVVGLSLPSHFEYCKPVKWRTVSAARDCPKGGLLLVRAASALMPTPGLLRLSARDLGYRDESRYGTHECVRHLGGPVSEMRTKAHVNSHSYKHPMALAPPLRK